MLTFGEYGGLLTVTYNQELYLSRRIDLDAVQLKSLENGQGEAVLERITLELQRSLDHFDRQYHFITVAKLLLVAPLGDGGRVKDYLATNLYLPVEDFSLDSVLDLERAPQLRERELQQRFLLAVGAALRHEEKVL